MTDKPNDRLDNMAPPDGDPETEPKIYMIVGHQKMPRPGLETYFAQVRDDADADRPKCSCEPVGAVICSCNKVCTCVPVCGCVQNKVCTCVPACSCVGHTRPGGSYGGGCRCAPVH